MKRRDVLAGLVTIAGGALAGCLGDGAEDEFVVVDEVQVPLVSAHEAIDWHGEGDTLFLDARPDGYEDLRIEGAEFSPFPDGLEPDDPTDGVPKDTRIVTYCVCPHAQSTQRGASLIQEGFTEVYALDEGLQEWYESGYPVAGNSDEVTGHY